MDRTAKHLVGSALVLLLTSSVAWAQATAQFSGTVTDDSGGVLPGVTVTATQTDTGVTRTVVTDGTGAYVMPNLPLGPYQLDVALAGFQTYVRTGLVLQVGGTPVIDVALGLSALQETVTVEAAAPLVDVQSAGIGEVTSQAQILELPLQGRQVTDLIILSGAAVDTGQISGNRNSNQSVAISVAGGLRAGMAYTLDGSMHNDPYDNTNLPFPFPDALQEFEVATGGLSAQNGMHSAGAVNAVTKSGSNRFSGNLFEFLRDHRVNATDHFAAIGDDGEPVSDGLTRNQYGGTLGGPIIANRLFFFGAFQGTRTRQTPASFVAFVPTAQMLAGDMTTYASPLCNRGRQRRLSAPYVNNILDPALLSDPAVFIANQLPPTSDPCGRITYSVPLDNNDWQGVGKVDYQVNADHSVFGRFIRTVEKRDPTFSRTGNPLSINRAFGANKNWRAQTVAFGDTYVIGPTAVNAFRVTYNRSRNNMNDPPDEFWDGRQIGVNIHPYVPGVLPVNISNSFRISGGNSVKFISDNKSYQVGNDLTLIRGQHQLAVGGNVAYWTSDQADFARAAGDFTFNGRETGLPMADFLAGMSSRFRHGAPGLLGMNMWYVGTFVQDTWRATDRVTFNLGLRWEPFLGQGVKNDEISTFSLDNFRNGVTSTVFNNAPAGLSYPGDPGFPSGSTGLNKQWLNFSPRVGVAWDVTGDGRTAVRSSYGLSYDFPGGTYLYIAASAAPWGNRTEFLSVPFADPYRDIPGGTTHPVTIPQTADARYPAFGAFSTMDPEINSPRAQSWNVTVERQLGDAWQASASYLGSYLDRLWGQVHLNPGVFLGLDSCTLPDGSFQRTCTTNRNLDQRRVLSLENPELGQGLGNVVRFRDVGTQDYRGMKLSLRRRAGSGVSLSGNYTWSRCKTDTNVSGGFSQFSAGYTKPEDPGFDRGNCTQNRSHLANLTIGVLTPQLDSAVLRAVASDWRVSGILNARSGSWLNVDTTLDSQGTGISGRRPDQILADPYGDKTLDNYLNPEAFATPAPGTFGNSQWNGVEGPGFWTVDLAVSKIVTFGATQDLELRVETFNLFNNFNWGRPVTRSTSGRFGQITSQAGTPRIMQFGIKYGF